MPENSQPIKILLAEDDGDDRAFFSEFLGDRADIDLLPMATNGAEVLDYLQAAQTSDGRPDLIVLDQNMPKLNGKETLKALKSAGGYPAIPVVIYSTYVGEQLLKECLTIGAALVIAKPDSPEGYGQMMDEILTRCRV
jgi:CheY-like chemotaxis protein